MKTDDMKKSEQLARFGSDVRERRKNMELSAERFSELIPMSDRQIRKIETGKAEPGFWNGLNICVACSIDIGELKRYLEPDQDPKP